MKVSDKSKSIAELAAMRAKGELTAQQFEEAKRLIEENSPSASASSAIPLKPQKQKTGCGTLVLAMTGVLLLIGWLGGASKEQKSPSETLAEETENKRKGFHCLSGWDGSQRELYDSVKNNLRDPSSMEHVETRVAPVDAEGLHSLTMQFRAKNGFGGTNVGMAVGTIRNSDCKLVDWRMLKN